jgi:hypothetical protein
MLIGISIPSKVRRALLLHNALVEEIRQRHVTGDRTVTQRLARGKIIHKYRLHSHFSRTVGIARAKPSKAKHCKQLNEIQKVTNQIKHFLEDDEHSRLAPGKKDTITRKKVKKQKRYLCHTLQYLHEKFVQQYSVISYSLFCRLRPFWVIKPKPKDRDTCRCIVHENVELMVDKLKQLRIIESKDLEVLAAQICCDIKKKKCMYRECKACKEKVIHILEYEPSDETFYWHWEQKKEEYEDKVGDQTKKMISKITMKDKQITTKGKLVELFNKEMALICKHIFIMKHQFQELRKLKKDLEETEAVVHVDFSENFNCGYGSEVQAAHFGASHRQATLHTGVLYTIGGFEPFCTISDSRRHDPAAIWAHIEPILNKLKEEYPKVEVLHFKSDGPTTQYRNRTNMYLLSSRVHERGFRKATWNFTAAGHDKGAPDGVGGTIKCTADVLISEGKDIPNARCLFDTLK